jgi:hypothetical protein
MRFTRARSLTLLAVSALVGSTAVVSAQPRTANVIIVHGINGAALGAPSALPVDVSVNGACALPGFQYKQIVGPLVLPAGVYDVAVHPANPSSPCGLPAIIGPARIPLAPGEDAAIIAHLTAAAAPTASKYTVNLSPTVNNKARVSVFHTAAAPAVDAYLTAPGGFGNVGQTAFLLRQFVNNEQAVVSAPAGAWDLSVAVAGSSAAVIGPATVRLAENTAYLFFVVGEPTSGTLDVIVKDYSGLGGQ